MNQLAPGGRKRQNGNLYHVVLLVIVVDPVKLLGMHQVFGVMGDHDVEMRPALGFKPQHALEDPVQIVGFRRRSVLRTYRQVHGRETLGQLARHRKSLQIIGVDAYEKIAAFIAVRRQIVLDHLPYHVVLAPQRDEDGDALSGGIGQLRLGWWRHDTAPQPDCDEPPAQTSEVEEKIVEAAEEEPNCEDRQHGKAVVGFQCQPIRAHKLTFADNRKPTTAYLVPAAWKILIRAQYPPGVPAPNDCGAAFKLRADLSALLRQLLNSSR